MHARPSSVLHDSWWCFWFSIQVPKHWSWREEPSDCSVLPFVPHLPISTKLFIFMYFDPWPGPVYDHISLDFDLLPLFPSVSRFPQHHESLVKTSLKSSKRLPVQHLKCQVTHARPWNCVKLHRVREMTSLTQCFTAGGAAAVPRSAARWTMPVCARPPEILYTVHFWKIISGKLCSQNLLKFLNPLVLACVQVLRKSSVGHFNSVNKLKEVVNVSTVT